jgi:predicted transcriptional regulator
VPSTSPHQLGRRERQIMDAVYELGRATASEVLEALPDPPSYSAVRGMLRLLEDKGFLRHEQDGPRYVYLPTADREQVRRSAAKHLLRTFFNNSAASAVAAILGEADGGMSQAELDRLARMIDDAREKGGAR